MSDVSGNRGEWSEVYAFLKLLGDGKLYGADADLNRKDDIFYQILSIIRNEKIGVLHFMFDGGSRTVSVQTVDGEIKATISADTFTDEANHLYEEICKAKSPAFQVVKTSRFMDDILCQKLKAPSEDKSDITIRVHDFNTGLTPTLGFSIKSRIGKPATLLNAGTNTNFVYEITGNVTDADMNAINDIFVEKTKTGGDTKQEISIAQRIEYIKSRGFGLLYDSMTGDTFENNLILIDSDLPKITATLMLEYYLNGTTNIYAALNAVASKNPLGYNIKHNHPFYHYKFKKLITESALGMLPGKVWEGKADASGGYIVVREDGEVLCYHLYNRNEFEDYLLKNVRFDRGGAGRHAFAVVEKNNGKYYIKLNLQIRFIH